jgi:hypothetical protein
MISGNTFIYIYIYFYFKGKSNEMAGALIVVGTGEKKKIHQSKNVIVGLSGGPFNRS